MAMNLWLARRELVEGFILVYDDILFESQLIGEVLAAEGSVLLAVDRKGIDREAEKVALQQDAVSAIGKNVTAPFGEYIGVARFSREASPALVKELEQVARTDLDTSFPQLIQRLIDHGQQVQVLATDRLWSDIDFPGDLEEARRLWGTW